MKAILILKEIIYLLFNRIPRYFVGKYLFHNLVKVHWGRGLNNFGDCLSPYILKHYGLMPVYVTSYVKSDIILAGSILQWIPNNFSGYIIGTGGDEKKYDFPNATILAVRGKMTLSNLKQRKEDIRLGDPGILMPLIFNEDVNRIYRLGVIAHFVDMDSPKLTLWQQKFSNDTLFNTSVNFYRKIKS